MKSAVPWMAELLVAGLLDSLWIHRRLLSWWRGQRNEERQVDEGQIRRERALYLVRLLVFGWWLAAAQIVWTVRIAIVLGVLILVGLYRHRLAPTM